MTSTINQRRTKAPLSLALAGIFLITAMLAFVPHVNAQEADESDMLLTTSIQGIRGNLGGLDLSGKNITGWAFSLINPTSTLRVELSTSQGGSPKTVVATVLTDSLAPRVNETFNIAGTHRFRYVFPESYCGTTLTWYADVVRSNGTRTPLNHSPREVNIPSCASAPATPPPPPPSPINTPTTPSAICREQHPGTPSTIGFFKCVSDIVLPRHIASTTFILPRIEALSNSDIKNQLLNERQRIIDGESSYLSIIRSSTVREEVRNAWLRANHDYETFLVFLPKVATAERAATNLEIASGILQAATLIQERINGLPSNHVSRARLQSLHDTIVAQTNTARSTTESSLAQIMALRPSGGNAAVKASNKEARITATAALFEARNNMRSVRTGPLQEAQTILNSINSIACALDAPASVRVNRKFALAWNTSGGPASGTITQGGATIFGSVSLPSGSATTTAPSTAGSYTYELAITKDGQTVTCRKDIVVRPAPVIPIATPSATPVAGTYRTPQSVVLSSSPGAAIRFTTDGTTPSCALGTIYSSPVPISAPTTIKAIACTANGTSSVASHAYQIIAAPNDFGFFMVDTGTDDPNDDEARTDFLLEVKPFSTVGGGGGLIRNPAASIVENLKKFKAQGVKPIVAIGRLSFLGPDLHPRPDSTTLIDAFVRNNEGYLTQEYIKAFYVVDEPYWKWLSKNNGVCGSERALNYEQFASSSRYLKLKIPDVPQYFSESHNCVSMMQIPPTIDYVSFHDYAMKDPSTDSEYIANLRTLASKLSPTQKLWLVMDAAYSPPRYQRAGIAPNEMGSIAAKYWKLACSEEFAGKIDTIFAYRWPADSADAAPGTLGARDFSTNVKNVYKQIFNRIKTHSCEPVQP